MRLLVSTTVALIALVSVDVARADVVAYEVNASASLAQKDARIAALDKAFANAVWAALGDIMTPPVRDRHQGPLASAITKRARLYVASFSTLSKREAEGSLQLRVAVKIDRGRLRTKLTELGLGGGDATGATTARPRMVILAKSTINGATSATFGRGGRTDGVVGQTAASELSELGFDIAAAQDVAVPTTAGTEARLPVDDAAAAQIATQAGAGAAIVIGALSRPDGRIRGTASVGATATVWLRIVDAQSGDVVAAGEATLGGFGVAAAAATHDAAVAAVGRAFAGTSAALEARWPPLAPTRNAILVELRVDSWATVSAIIARLAATKGVHAVHAPDARQDRVVLAVEGITAPGALAGVVRGTRLPQGRLSAQVHGTTVLVTVDAVGLP